MYPKKSIPSPQRNACYTGCTWLSSLQHHYIETTTYDNQSSSFLKCFLTILKFDSLRKWVTARVTPTQLLPVQKPRQIISVDATKESISFPLKWNFSFTKHTLWSEGKHQRWNKRPSYSLKRQVFFLFCSQHCCRQFAGFWVFFLDVLTHCLTGYSFRVLFSNLIQFSFTYKNIWLAETVRQRKKLQHCHACVCPFRPKNCAWGHDVGHWWQLPIF